jgi:hypothetical protein
MQTPAPAADCQITLAGVLRHADFAMKPTGDGHFVPAVVLEIDDVGPGHNRVVAHVPYPPDQRADAEAKARSLRRGDPISVRTHLVDMRLMLPAASFSTDTP